MEATRASCESQYKITTIKVNLVKKTYDQEIFLESNAKFADAALGRVNQYKSGYLSSPTSNSRPPMP